jgi:farnesyl diphosphate synthase
VSLGEEALVRGAQRIEPVLAALLPPESEPPVDLHRAMRYAALGGGKRLRPSLCVEAARAVGGDAAADRVLPAAAALELIHVYSLVHDDLPAMDDGELRHGRPCCHRVFGDALALLAGDALQTLAFTAITRPIPGVAAERQLAAAALLAHAAGSLGMAGGQALDLAGTADLEALEAMERLKTGALIHAAVAVGGELAGADAAERAALSAYGRDLGLCYQIADDVLDVVGETVTLGKVAGADARLGKPTYVDRLGLEGARALALEVAERAGAALAPFGRRGEVLADIARFAATRAR